MPVRSSLLIMSRHAGEMMFLFLVLPEVPAVFLPEVFPVTTPRPLVNQGRKEKFPAS